jgi:hypothetical protein
MSSSLAAMANIASAARSMRNTSTCSALIALLPALTQLVATLQPAVARFVHGYDILCNVWPYAS